MLKDYEKDYESFGSDQYNNSSNSSIINFYDSEIGIIDGSNGEEFELPLNQREIIAIRNEEEEINIDWNYQ